MWSYTFQAWIISLFICIICKWRRQKNKPATPWKTSTRVCRFPYVFISNEFHIFSKRKLQRFSSDSNKHLPKAPKCGEKLFLFFNWQFLFFLLLYGQPMVTCPRLCTISLFHGLSFHFDCFSVDFVLLLNSCYPLRTKQLLCSRKIPFNEKSQCV